MSSSVVSSRRQSPWPGPVPVRPRDASPDSIAAISNSTAAPAPSVSRPASTRCPASSTATTRTSPDRGDRLSIRTSPAYPSDDADGTYGTVCASSAHHAHVPHTATAIRANMRRVDHPTAAPRPFPPIPAPTPRRNRAPPRTHAAGASRAAHPRTPARQCFWTEGSRPGSPASRHSTESHSTPS